MFDLTGKNALVTGATGGIGKEIVANLVAQGAKVIITGTRENVLQEIKQNFTNSVDYIVTNLSDSTMVANLFDDAEKLLGQIDVLVCNAGITKDTLAMRMSDEQWQEVMDVNLTATFKLNRAAIKKMMKRRDGRIINISSIVGVTGNAGQANYVASKSGMIGMSKSLAQEVAARGITVNCIAPGFIATPMTDVLNDKVKEGILSKIPAGKMGVSSDIASGVVYLASKEAAYVTGQTLHINGGMYM